MADAMPGEVVWAMGLHAGVRKRFKATVTKLRDRFPRSAPPPLQPFRSHKPS